MATIAELNVRLAADAKQMIYELNKASSEFRKKSREMAELGDNMFAAVTLPVIGLGAAAISSAADIEKLTNAMTTTMGSAEAAAKEIELLREAAKAPGLDFEQAIKGSVRLQAVGLSAEDSRRALSAFGNALALAGGSASDLDGIALALGQIAAKGKVSAEEINQLAERTPQIRMAMQDAFGTADTEQLQKMGITAEKFISEIITSFEKLPPATAGLSESLTNFNSSVKIAFANLGQSINKAIDFEGKLNTLADAVNSVAKWFSELSPQTQKFIVYAGLGAAAIGPLAKAAAAFNGVAAVMTDQLKNVVKAKAFLILKFAEAQKAFMALNMAMKATVIGAIAAAVVGLVAAFQHFNSTMSEAERATKAVADAQIQAKQSIVEEEMRVDALIAKIKDETTAREDKQAAINELQKIAPEIFGTLNTERDLTQQLTDGKQKYIEALLRQAEAEAYYKTIVEKKQKLLSISLNSEEAQLTTLQEITKWMLKATSPAQAFAYEQTTLAKNSKAAEDALKSEIIALEERLKLLNAPIAAAPGLQPSAAGGGGGEDPEKKRAKGVVDVLTELEKKYGDVATRAQLFGDTSGVVAERSGLLKDAIGELLEMGLSPTDTQVLALSERLATLNSNAEALPTTFANVASGMLPVLETITTANEKIRYFGNIGDALTTAAATAGKSMYEMAASGETSFKKLGKAALKSAADIIRGYIMQGVAAVVSDALKKFGLIGLAIGAAAGAGAGVLFNQALKAIKVPALAKGGLAYGPQLAMVGDNPGAATDPEVIAPLSKLQGIMGRTQQITGTVRVSGSDLLIMLENAERNQRRYGT